MQNDDVRGKSAWGWLAEYRNIIIFAAVLVFVYLIYKLCTREVTQPELSLDPVTGAVVDDSTGNQDTEINPGEQPKVRLRLTNIGREPVSAFDLVLSTQEKKVELIDNRLHFAAIAPGQTVLSDDPFEFKLDTSFVLNCVSFTSRIESTARAGFVNDAFAQNGNPPPIVLAVVSNYHVCVGACTLQQDNSKGATTDILSINLELCNGSVTNPPTNPPGPTLTDPSVTIVVSTLKACKTPIPVTETIVVTDNDLEYDNVAPGSCATPDIAGPTNFQFRVPKSWFNSVTPPQQTICVHFSAEIYSGTTTKTYQGTAYVGIKATLQ